MAEAEAASAPAVEKEKKKGRKGLLFALLGAIVVLGAGGGGAFFWMSRGGDKGSEKPVVAGEHGGHGGAGQESGRHGVLSLEPFIVNLADPEGDRYIKCTMRLVLDHPDSAEAVKSDDLAITRVRDRILTLLSSKAFAQVATPEGKETLRKEIQTSVTSVLQSAEVSEVYYTEFIVQ